MVQTRLMVVVLPIMAHVLLMEQNTLVRQEMENGTVVLQVMTTTEEIREVTVAAPVQTILTMLVHVEMAVLMVVLTQIREAQIATQMAVTTILAHQQAVAHQIAGRMAAVTLQEAQVGRTQTLTQGIQEVLLHLHLQAGVTVAAQARMAVAAVVVQAVAVTQVVAAVVAAVDQDNL